MQAYNRMKQFSIPTSTIICRVNNRSCIKKIAHLPGAKHQFRVDFWVVMDKRTTVSCDGQKSYCELWWTEELLWVVGLSAACIYRIFDGSSSARYQGYYSDWCYDYEEQVDYSSSSLETLHCTDRGSNSTSFHVKEVMSQTGVIYTFTPVYALNLTEWRSTMNRWARSWGVRTVLMQRMHWENLILQCMELLELALMKQHTTET